MVGLNMKTASVFVAVLISAAALASPARANLILNGGFEANGTQVYVPQDWTANAAYTATNYNAVTAANVHSGGWSLRTGNLDTQPVPVLSQSFSDVSGTTTTSISSQWI
jgi:hypothetical protein